MEDEHYYENGVEEIAFCEGGSLPLESNRTSELAMECWNLRKTVMEQTAQNVKLKKELKTVKNLVKSLQRTVSECEAESLAKTKDIHAKKLEILQCDKKNHELTATNNILNSSYTRAKKLAANLQRKLEESEKTNVQLQEQW
jgi:ABC-type branched-subunit amino acid transport system ATPase component